MERVELQRECEAVQIPAGTTITLEKGLEVFITQSLGGTFTLQVPAHKTACIASPARMRTRSAKLQPRRQTPPRPAATSK
jgi:hypothetical protein